MTFKLDPAPTFRVEVRVTVPGGGFLPLPLVFKHMTRSQLNAWLAKEQPDQEMLGDIVEDAPTRPEAMTTPQFLDQLCEKYPASPLDIYLTFRRELQESRAKN